jgi:hypothetical protein
MESNIAIITEEYIKCAICTEPINGVCSLDCGHDFCGECIEEWLEKIKKCPLCKKKTRILSNPNYIVKSVIDLYIKSNQIKREEKKYIPIAKRKAENLDPPKKKVYLDYDSKPLVIKDDNICDECFHDLIVFSGRPSNTNKTFEKNCKNSDCFYHRQSTDYPNTRNKEKRNIIKSQNSTRPRRSNSNNLHGGCIYDFGTKRYLDSDMR